MPVYSCVHAQSLQLCPTLCDPMESLRHQASLSMRFSRQEYWSEFLCPPPGNLPDPGIKPRSPALQADSLPLSHRGSPYMYINPFKKIPFIVALHFLLLKDQGDGLSLRIQEFFKHI